eukprot:COSAG01_NODE_1052_length_11920_cov_6.553760_8_plen_130_part_00
MLPRRSATGVKTPWLVRPELNGLQSKKADIVVCGRVVIPSLHVSDEEEETSAKRHCGGVVVPSQSCQLGLSATYERRPALDAAGISWRVPPRRHTSPGARTKQATTKQATTKGNVFCERVSELNRTAVV